MLRDLHQRAALGRARYAPCESAGSLSLPAGGPVTDALSFQRQRACASGLCRLRDSERGVHVGWERGVTRGLSETGRLGTRFASRFAFHIPPHG